MGFDSGGIVFDDGAGGVIRPPAELRAAGAVPVLVNRQWRNGVLLNSTEYDGDAWALYRDERLPSRVGYRRWEERYPSGAVPVADSMPKANVAVTWGDFLVLGDIVWKENPSNPLSDDNSARYPHGLWFSEPGTFDSWDELEVQFVGQRSGSNIIVGMFPMEPGLLVTTTSGIYLLRGEPQANSTEELRIGLGPAHRRAVAFWPYTGGVVWIDRNGEVWATNGEEFSRLDEHLPPFSGGACSVVAHGQHLLVCRGGRNFVLYAGGEGGAWTELNAEPNRGGIAHRGSVYVWAADGLRRWGVSLPSRGHSDGEPVLSRVVTRTLSGEDPHMVTFWHRVGLAAGGGDILSARSKAGPWSADAPVAEHVAPAEAGERFRAVVPAHGPSVEASFGWEAEGDVRYEAVTVWAHRGRGER